MSYKKVVVDKFVGFNSTVAPELLPDGAARDILNFRQEKVGKLMSRNGVVIGLFHSNMYPSATPDFTPAWAYYNNKGVVGIGEYVLSEYWAEYDTDRLMVYAVRAEVNDSFVDYTAGTFPEETQKYKLAFLFSPVTGTKQDLLLCGIPDPVYPGIPTYEADANPNGDMEETKTLYAANREITGITQDGLTSAGLDHWIERYLHFNQFRSKLVISDRINGDMLLENDFDRADITACDTAEHRLRLRPNCIGGFNIDDIELDARFEADEENDETAGVLTGMALYKYNLPKKVKKPTIDNFSNLISNPDWTGWKADAADDDPTKFYKVLDLMSAGNSSTLFNILWARESGYEENRIWWWINHNGKSTNYYCFSNANTAEEFDDLLGNLEFPNDEFVDQKTGKVVKQIAPDVYIWEDYRLKYYPCSGKDLGVGHFFTENDRGFHKLQIGIPRTLDLPEKLPSGKEVPLGVWRYRFVWDFGGGVYSAPSAEMLCPDVLWSATKDNDIYYNSSANYYRNQPLKIVANDSGVVSAKDTPYWEGQYLAREAPYTEAGKAELLVCPSIFESNGDLTNFGEILFDLKFHLYHNIYHRYGVKGWDNYNDLESASDADKGEFAVFATAFFSKSNLELSGFSWEGAATSTSTCNFWNGGSTKMFGDANYHHIHGKGKMVVPIFQNYGNKCSFNSLFDDNGKLRLAYASDPTNIKIQIVIPGLNWGLSDTDVRLTGEEESSPSEVYFPSRASTLLLSGVSNVYHDSNLYINIVCLNDPSADTHADMNNESITFASKEKRPHTILRAINTELDRLNVTNAGIDSEALSRLFLTGVTEIHVCAPSDAPVIGAEKQYLDTTLPGDSVNTPITGKNSEIPRYEIKYRDAMDYDRTRFVTVVDSFPFDKTIIEDGFDAEETIHDIENVMDEEDSFNMDVYVYGEGERFTGVEQLTAYFPSSLLFEAPRIAIKIPAAKVPARAKRLLIFRSRSSHSNEFQANDYGLVDTIDIYREAGVVVTPDYKGDADYPGIYYFDDVKDKSLNFGVSPEEYEGLREPIRSALNMPLNERVYYLNYKQAYQPISPRKYEEKGGVNDINNFTYSVDTVDTTEDGFDTTSEVTLRYKFLYRDINNILSQAIDVPSVEDPPVFITLGQSASTKSVVVFYYVPSSFDGTVGAIEVYREKDGAGVYYHIGDVLPEDEGVFVDNDRATGKVFECDDAVELTYESGIIYSQPYFPGWIKPENTLEVRSGDGKQITAVHNVAGNLVVFKENSIHRIAVQGAEVPISRVDEISPDIGCIAKNANVNIDGIIYFLSHKGFMRFDNNQIQKVDGPFDEELQFVLAHASESDIRDIACGYNAYYNEIYLNIPMLPTGDTELQQEYGQADYFENRNNSIVLEGNTKSYFQKTIYGHIYVINLDKQYATKFGYTPTFTVDSRGTGVTDTYREVLDSNQLLRLYFTNSFGQLRTGDIHPVRFKSIDEGKLWAGIYCETPYRRRTRVVEYIDPNGSIYSKVTEFPLFTDTDEVLSPFAYVNSYVFLPGANDFPLTTEMPFKSVFKSKFFTSDDESLIKRIRKVTTNIFSRGPIYIKGITIYRKTDSAPSVGELPDDVLTFGDDRIENLQFDIGNQTFEFRPTINVQYPLKLVGGALKGTGSNVLECILRDPMMQYYIGAQNDWLGKPVRFSVETESTLRTQLNMVSFEWRLIHTYLM